MRRLSKRVTRPAAIVTVLILLSSLYFLWMTGASAIKHLADALVATYVLLWALVAFVSDASREELRRQFILTTATLGACLLLVEAPGWMGIVDYRQVFSTAGLEPWDKPGVQLDDELWWAGRPHYRVQGTYEQGNIGKYLCGLLDKQRYDVNVRYDENGFRNESDLTTADVAIVGDSYVESLMMPHSVLMTSVLGALEQSTVANLGLSGYGPQQELAVLKKYALNLHPKTIVWVFYEGNDLLDVQRYDRFKERAEVELRRSRMGWERSFTKNVLTSLISLSEGCTPHTEIAKRYVIIRDPESGPRAMYFLDHIPALSSDDFAALEKTASALETAYRLCRERGIRFVVAFAPEVYRVYHGLRTVIDASDEVKHWQLTDLPQRLHDIVAGISDQIDYVDLTPFLRAEAENGVRVFLPDDSHWTADGHRIAANALHRFALASSTPVAEQGGEPRQQGSRMLAQQEKQRSTQQEVSQSMAPVVAQHDLEHVALMVRNPDGTIRFWSEAAERLYGWAAHDALGKSSHHLLHTVFQEPLAGIEAQLAKTGQWKGELVHQRRDGSQVVVASRWELQHDAKGHFTTVVEINSDHTVKQPNWLLNENLALMVRAPEGTIRYWNKGAQQLYGWGPREALGESSHRLLRTVFPESLPEIEAELFKTGHWEGKLVHKRRDGSEVTVASRWELQRNGTDKSATVIEINRKRRETS